MVGAIWSAPPCRLYSTLRKDDGGPPPLRSLYHTWMDYQTLRPNNFNKFKLQQVQESQEIHRRSSTLCTSVFQQGGFAGSEQPINSLAWQEPFHQQFLRQFSCYFVSTSACKWRLDWFKLGPLQQPRTKFKLLQVSAPMKTTSASKAKDWQMVPLSARFQQNIHPHLRQQSLTLSNLGFPNHQPSTRTSPIGDCSSPKRPSLQGLA